MNLASILAALQGGDRFRQNYDRMADANMEQPGLQPLSEYTNRRPMPFREPMQDTGPLPPMDPRILAALRQR